MSMSSLKKLLPQEGTSCSAGGESLRAVEKSAARCPSYSGGGTSCSGKESEKDGEKRKRSTRDKRETVQNEDRRRESSVCSEDSMVVSSCCSSPKRTTRKRAKGSKNASSDSSTESEASRSGSLVSRTRPSKRGRGRPPTTGQYVGLAAAKQAYLKAQREELELRAEQEVVESVHNLREKRRAVHLISGNITADPATRLQETAQMALTIAAKARNPKGTYIKALKEMATTIKEATEDLASRSANEETLRLQALSERQEAEILQLRKEVEDVRAEMVRLAQTTAQPTPAPTLPNEDDERRLQIIMRAVGSMLDARLAGLEARLLPEPRLRPPLAADARRRSRESEIDPDTAGLVSEATPPYAALPQLETNKKVKPKKQKGNNKKTTPSAPPEPPAPPEPRAFPPAPAALTVSWATVARRGARPRREKEPAPTTNAEGQRDRNPAPLKPKKKGRKKRLRAPRSQAVILRLHPEAIEKGLSYREVLAEARASIDAGALGIPIEKVRSAITGAKILIVSGEDQIAKADLLAEKLKEVLSSKRVTVTRPIVTAAIRISGLDDSLTEEEICTELARIGECSVDAVKAGSIKPGSGGMGQVLVRCPIAAAKKIVTVTKLRIGWSVVRVHLLEARRLQCFRCHALGHVGARCPSSVDRSHDCYRCGQTGHVASGCTLAPRCAVCASAGKPAEHTSGGKACARPPRKPRREDVAAPAAAPVAADRSQLGETTTPMDVQPPSGTRKTGAL